MSAVLIADFLLRLYGGKRFTPLHNLSREIQRRLDLLFGLCLACRMYQLVRKIDLRGRE